MSDERDQDDPRDPAVSGLYAQLPCDEPPAHLDAAILAAARREVDSKPRPVTHRPSSHWQALAAIAAVIVLSLLLVPALLDEEQLARQTPTRERPGVDDSLMQEADEMMPAEPAPISRPVPEGEAVGGAALPSSGVAQPPAAAPFAREEQATGIRELKERQDAGRALQEQRAGPAPALSAPKSEMADFADAAPSFEERLDAIRRLAAQGEIALARQRLEALREAYPDAVIEPELLERLGVAPAMKGVSPTPPAVE
jgi:soluble cytochrome b562